MDNLKIYCESENDQAAMVEFCFDIDPECNICTWEPDGDTESDGSWGMFVDNFDEGTWDKLVESMDSLPLEHPVEMCLETDNIFKQFP